ncbi:MAG: NUDIX domain-containing protein [Patescibacteria group bacterium]
MSDQRKVIPGVHLIFQKYNNDIGENEYLLHKRMNTNFFDKHFSVPGGHIDDYETPTDCVVREGKEELGVDIDPKYIKFANVLYRIKKSDHEVRIDFCYIITKWKGILKANEQHKHSEPAWYPLSKFPTPVVPYVLQAIQDIESGIAYTKTDI